MAYKLRVTEKAEADLDGIIQYLMVDLANPKAVGALLDAIELPSTKKPRCQP